MKKYRLTKITVKTREIVFAPAQNAADENDAPVCPLCHLPLAPVLPSAARQPAAELSTAILSGDEAQKLKGDL